jgi:hypothetical protein
MLHSETVRTYTVGEKKISVVLCWGSSSDHDKFYDIYDDSTGTCLNLGEPWHDDGEGPPSQEDVAWLVKQGDAGDDCPTCGLP